MTKIFTTTKMRWLGSVLLLVLALAANSQTEYTRDIPFLPSGDGYDDGMLRIINHTSENGIVSITAFDDEGAEYGPVSLDLSRDRNVLLYTKELENGSSLLSEGLGRGAGDWRLILTSKLNFEAISYAVTQDGLLSDLTATVQSENGCSRVSTFYASDSLSTSRLRISNPNDVPATVKISGRDDLGVITASPIVFDLPANASIALSSQDLEESNNQINGKLGDGHGDWQLAIESHSQIDVINLLESFGNQVSNISTRPSYAVGHCWLGQSLANADRSILRHIQRYVDDPPQHEDNFPGVPAIYAATVNAEGVQSIAAAGVKKFGEDVKATVNDKLLISSNTKPMTATMISVLVENGVFENGWDTTFATVFPDLLDLVHESYAAVTLRQVVIHEGAVLENLKEDWVDDESLDITQRRIDALVAHLDQPPIASPGRFVEPGTFRYSHVGYMVAGAFAERVMGQTYESLMQEYLFDPLGMSGAGFDNPGKDGTLEEPWGHLYSRESQWVPTQTDYSAVLRPSGGVHVSLEDWAKFIQLWLPGKEPVILTRKILNDMLVFAWIDRDPFVFLGSRGVNSAGWFYHPRIFAFGSALNHPGSNLRWHSLVWVMRDINKAYITVTNSHIPVESEFEQDNPTYEYVLNPVFQRIAQSSVRSEPPKLPAEIK